MRAAAVLALFPPRLSRTRSRSLTTRTVQSDSGHAAAAVELRADRALPYALLCRTPCSSSLASDRAPS